jgi:Uma2 family endonuclease
MKTLTADNGKSISYEEFLQIEEELCQLINGKLYMTPAPNPKHQLIIGELYSIFKNQSKGKIFFSPIDVYLDDKNIFQPDLLFINEENKGLVSERGIEGAPDLIVEVLSPSNAYLDRNIKKDIYFEKGVKDYSIVDLANQTLELYTLKQKDKRKPHIYLVKEGTVTSTVIPKLKFDVAEVFKVIEN